MKAATRPSMFGVIAGRVVAASAIAVQAHVGGSPHATDAHRDFGCIDRLEQQVAMDAWWQE